MIRVAVVVMAVLAGLAPARSQTVAPAVNWFDPVMLDEPRWSVMAFGGVDTGNATLLTLLGTPWEVDGDDVGARFVGVAASRRLVRLFDHWTVEAELGAGRRFGMRYGHAAAEGWGAVFLRFDGFPWNHLIRTTVAVSTGLHYASRLPDSEAGATDRGAARWLHYLSPEITFALPDRDTHELVLRVHHRSSGYGLMWDVSTGSNVVTVGYRHRF